MAAEQLTSINAVKPEAAAPVAVPQQVVPVEPEPTSMAPVAVPAPAPVDVPLAPAPAPAPLPELAPASQASEPAIAPQAEVTEPVESSAPIGMTREDAVAAFRLFLRREPESEAVIEPYLGRERERLLGAFMTSAEFLQHPEHVRLLVEVAQAIQRRQAVQPPRDGVPTLTEQDLASAHRMLFSAAPVQAPWSSLVGQPADWALACLLRSDEFQRDPFNARLVLGLASEIVGQLKQQKA